MMIEDDIYGDLENFRDEEDLKELKAENELFRDEVNNLKLTNQDLTKEYLLVKQQLQECKTKISSLLMAARSELKRKDRLIADLNKEKDEIVFRNFKYRNNFSEFDPIKQGQNECTGQKRKLETHKHDDAKKLKVNDRVLENKQPPVSFAPKIDHINSDTTKNKDDKNCLQKLIIEMEEDSSSNKSKASKIKLNRRKSMCGYEVEDNSEVAQFNEGLNAVKHEFYELKNYTNSCRVETNGTTIEETNVEQDDKYSRVNYIPGGIVPENLNKALKIEMNEKPTGCDSTTDYPKEGNRDVPWIPKRENGNSEISDEKKPFKIQRNRRQSMNENMKKDSFPEHPASVQHPSQNFGKDHSMRRRDHNASCSRQRDLRISRDYRAHAHGEIRDNRPISRIGSHENHPDIHMRFYGSGSDTRSGFDDRREARVGRRPDPRLTTRSQHDHPRSRHALRHRPRHRQRASRETKERRLSTRHPTRSQSRERYNVETHSQYRSHKTSTQTHKTSISTRIDETNTENVDAKNFEDFANTLSLMYSDSDESDSNEYCRKLDARQKNIEGFDLRQCLVNKMSCPELNATLSPGKTVQSSIVKSENNDVNQSSLLDSRNDIHAYISTSSDQSTERKNPLHSLCIEEGSLAECAPSSHFYQDRSEIPATSSYTITSPKEQNELQEVNASHSETVQLLSPKKQPIIFMEYEVRKIDEDSNENSKLTSNILCTNVEGILNVIPSTELQDPREKQFTAPTPDIDSRKTFELSHKTHIEVDLNLPNNVSESNLVDETRCTALPLQQEGNLTNESIMELHEEKLSNRRSPRKTIKEFKIPKINCITKDESKVPKLGKRNMCSKLKALVSKKEHNSGKTIESDRNGKNGSGYKVSTEKLESKYYKKPQNKDSKKFTDVQALQNTIATQEDVPAKASNAFDKVMNQSRKLTGTSTLLLKEKPKQAEIVEANKKRDEKEPTTTSPKNKTIRKNEKEKKQSIIETITQKTSNQEQENIKKIDASKPKKKKVNSEVMKLNNTHIDEPQVNERGNVKKIWNEATKKKFVQISEMTNHELRRNGGDPDSSQAETVNTRGKLCSYPDHCEDTTNPRDTCLNGRHSNKREMATSLDIEQPACQTSTSERTAVQNLHATRHLENNINQITKQTQSVIILDDEVCNKLRLCDALDESFPQIASRINYKNVKTEEKPIIVGIETKKEETSTKSLQSKVDNRNTKHNDGKCIQECPQRLSAQKYMNEEKEVLQLKLVNERPTSQGTQSSSNESNPIQTGEENG